MTFKSNWKMISKSLSNNYLTGIGCGIILPLIVFIIIHLIDPVNDKLVEYVRNNGSRDVLSIRIYLSVLPNLAGFWLFNRYSNEKSAQGVLGATILWALLTVVIKMF